MIPIALKDIVKIPKLLIPYIGFSEWTVLEKIMKPPKGCLKVIHYKIIGLKSNKYAGQAVKVTHLVVNGRTLLLPHSECVNAMLAFFSSKKNHEVLYPL